MKRAPKDTPLLALGLLLSAALLLRCSGNSATESSSPVAISGSSGSSGSGTSGSAGAGGGLAGTECTLPTDCLRPLEGCVGDGLLSYTDPTCDQGRCAWTSQVTACTNGCVAGACQTTGVDSGGSGGSGGTTNYGACSGVGEAGAADTPCELPPSVCADDRWLLYFQNAHCVGGSCQADVFASDCGNAGCRAGGCFTSITAK